VFSCSQSQKTIHFLVSFFKRISERHKEHKNTHTQKQEKERKKKYNKQEY